MDEQDLNVAEAEAQLRRGRRSATLARRRAYRSLSLNRPRTTAIKSNPTK
jgi:hypothetical protein